MSPLEKEEDIKTNGYGSDYFSAKWKQEVEDNAIDNPFRFGGEYKDEESGNYYLRARYYDPEIQRFTQEDTYKGDYKDPISLNAYAFCSNDPINNIDPSGHKSISKAAKKVVKNVAKSVKKVTSSSGKSTGNNSSSGSTSSSTTTSAPTGTLRNYVERGGGKITQKGNAYTATVNGVSVVYTLSKGVMYQGNAVVGKVGSDGYLHVSGDYYNSKFGGSAFC